MTNHIIQIKNASKAYRDDVALDDVTLNVYNGEFITLLGPSGCGKSTLLRVISGFENLDSGDIFINNKKITNIPPEQRHVNMVFQSYALFPHMNVYDNIAFGLRCQKLSNKIITEKVNNILKIVKLDKLAHRKPNQLSGGQQQRVAIARAVVNEPLVLLLDEPLSALDYHLRKNMQIELKQLQRRLGITFIFVTHDQEEALSMSDRVAVMRDGKIEQLGTPRDIYEEPCNLRVAKFIGQANIFDTNVIDATPDKISVNIENKTFALRNNKGCKKGQKIHVIIRPEDIAVWSAHEIASKNDKHDMLPATVDQVIYKGSTVDLVVKLASGKRVAATEFFNEDDEKLEYDLNENVWINWISGWEVILPDVSALFRTIN